jgi:hypothetical protein
MLVREGREKSGPLMVLNLAVQAGDALGADTRRSLQFRLWPTATNSMLAHMSAISGRPAIPGGGPKRRK